jgi:hypothetical protein
LCGEAEECVLIYAEEAIPEEYKTICDNPALPLAFATLLSAKQEGDAILVHGGTDNEHILESPQTFLKAITPAVC